MKALIINVGSSSLKFTVFDNNTKVTEDYFENIYETKTKTKKIKHVLEEYDVDYIVHRIVHGGKHDDAVKLTGEVYKYLRSIESWAPLHNPPQLDLARFCREHTDKPNFAVFDTAFHQSIPSKAKYYAIPKKLTEKGYVKYGFHGPSHKFVTKKLRGGSVSCHLGSGCSLAAVQDRVCLDTTMGFTPLEGLMMSSRSGDVDPGLILYLIQNNKYTAEDLNKVLNEDSGWSGVSGISKDMREVLKSDSDDATLAVEMFCYKTAKHILSMSAALESFDNLVFTAGIGERNADIRARICAYLSKFNVLLDPDLNSANKDVISAKESDVTVQVIPTNEELMMYLDTKELVQ